MKYGYNEKADEKYSLHYIREVEMEEEIGMRNNFYSRLDSDEKYIMKAIFYVFFVNGIFIMVIGALLPILSKVYGLSDTFSGALISAHFVGNLIAGFVAGVLPEYLGRKKSVLFLSSFVAVGFLLLFMVRSPWLLLLAFLFTGISRGSISNFNHTMVNEISDSSPSALNFLHSVFAVGAIMAPLLVLFSTKIMGDNGWRMTVFIISFLTFASVLLYSRMKIQEPLRSKEKTMAYGFLKSKFFWTNAGILFFYLAGESTINGWIIKYFIDAKIMTMKYAQILASILWVAILIGRLTVAFIGDHFKKKYILLVTTSGTVIFYFLLLSTINVTIITIAIIGIGLSMAGIFPTTISNLGKIIKTYPMAMGTLQVIAGVGAIIMPIMTGALSDRFGIYAGMSAVVVALVFMMACVVLLMLSGKKEAVLS